MNTSPAPGSLAAYLGEQLNRSLAGELPSVGTPRSLRQGISPPNKATPVIGVRRGGKTTCLHQLRRERLRAGRARECLPYLNFDDPRLDGISVRHLHALVQEYYARHPALKGQVTVTWCFDEIEAVPGWERFIRSLMESEKVEVFIAGSFASLMPPSSRAAPGSTGEIVVHPFSFEEYLRFHGQPVPQTVASLSPAQHAALETGLRELLERGGFPAVQRLAPAEREILLADTLDLALLRDVLEKRPGTSISVLRVALAQLLGDPAAAVGAEKLALGVKSHGHALTREGAQQILQYLEDAFLVRTVPVESTTALQRFQSRKIYPVDPALIPLYGRGGPASTAALEALVLLELERRGREVTCVSLPAGREVDFLARGAGGAQELIQVCSPKEDFGSIERALLALREAERLFPHATRRLLTLTRADIPKDLPVGLFVQPAYEWLLDRSG